MRYVISDLHLGHEKIIEHCDRPFKHIHDMNKSLIENWNDAVDETDTVLFLGDMSHDSSPVREDEWVEKLNGNILFVRGNHDNRLPADKPFPVVENCTIQHGRYRFYCEHQPVDCPGWQLHGHTHNNRPTKYPFIDGVAQRVNVSAELVDYTPVLLDDIVAAIDGSQSFRDINEITN